MAHISTTVLLAGFTTFIGFFSLAICQIKAIREWGIFSAIGVLFAVFIATSMLPASLMLIPHKDRKDKPGAGRGSGSRAALPGKTGLRAAGSVRPAEIKPAGIDI